MASGLMNPATWMIDLFRSATGSPRVTAHQIASTSAGWYSLNKICGHVGQLPLNCHRRIEGGSEIDRSHPGHQLMRVKPNPYQRPNYFKETTQTHALLWGNGRAFINRVNGVPVELIPMLPDRTVCCLIEGVKYHITQPKKDSTFEHEANGQRINWEKVTDPRYTVVVNDDDVFHVPGLGFDGIEGKSLMSVASESFGISVHADKRANKQVQSGFGARLLLEAPKGAFRNQDDAEKFLRQFREKHEAGADSETVGMLREGMEANILQMSNKDAQFLETRRQQREEAALWFCIESILGDGQTSYNSLEMKNLSYLSNCLMRWLVKWEEEANAKLLTLAERTSQSHYFKFNVASLLRADFQTTVTTLGQGIASRIFSPNEARQKLEMNPYDGGDIYENPAISPGSPGDSDGSDESQTEKSSAGAGGGSSQKSQSARMISAAEAVQKVYLGVGKMITSDEARRIVNDMTDAGLAVPGPEFAQSAAGAAMAIRSLMDDESQKVKAIFASGRGIADVRKFYKAHQAKLADTIKNHGGNPAAAKAHCERSLAYLERGNTNLDLTGSDELILNESGLCDET